MKKITGKYFELIEKLRQNVENDDIIEILNAVDEIKLFWSKYKLYLMNEIDRLNGDMAIIGGMMYPHFDENQHFLPLAHNRVLIIDDPISKMDELIRTTIPNLENTLDILKRTIDVFIKNKDIINNNNIIIIPLRLYYGIETRELNKLVNKMVFSIFSYMFDKEIKNDNDLENLAKEYDTFEKIDELIARNGRDILFIGKELEGLSMGEKIKEYYKNVGMDLNDVSNMQLPILFMANILYGYSAQICDIVNVCELIQSDLYLFIEIPVYYFNILLQNIYSENDDIYNKYLKTMIGYYLQQYLYYTNFNNMDLTKFCNVYRNKNLLNDIKLDYKTNKISRRLTDVYAIQEYVKNRVLQFYN